MDSVVLREEIDTDPLARGYATMLDAEVAADMNLPYRTLVRDTLSSAEIYEQLDITEFQGKTDAQKIYVRDLLGLGGSVQVGPASKARTVLMAIFGDSSVTISALAAILQVPISRATELGLGAVKPGHVQDARTLGE